MLRYLLTEDDVGSVRFGISPLCELGLSLRAIREPARFPLQLGWLRRTEEARAHLDMATAVRFCVEPSLNVIQQPSSDLNVPLIGITSSKKGELHGC